jgi:hypothetical protein
VGTYERAGATFCDYYSFMSYADFAAWVEADDESLPEISFSELSLRG